MKIERGRPVEAAELMHRLAHLFLASGNLDCAAESLDEACRLDPRNPRHFRALADCLARVLKTKRSIDTYDNLLAQLRSRGDHTGALDVAFRMLRIDPCYTRAAKVLETEYRLLGEEVKSATADMAEGTALQAMESPPARELSPAEEGSLTEETSPSDELAQL